MSANVSQPTQTFPSRHRDKQSLLCIAMRQIISESKTYGNINLQFPGSFGREYLAQELIATKERKEHIDRSLYCLFSLWVCEFLQPIHLWLRRQPRCDLALRCSCLQGGSWRHVRRSLGGGGCRTCWSYLLVDRTGRARHSIGMARKLRL